MGDYMNIDVRKYVIENFKSDSIEEIKKSITDSVTQKEEDSLIGLGVLFELAWSNANEDMQYNILNNIKKGMDNS
jgi:small acid-soluble spore protein I (minor)